MRGMVTLEVFTAAGYGRRWALTACCHGCGDMVEILAPHDNYRLMGDELAILGWQPDRDGNGGQYFDLCPGCKPAAPAGGDYEA